MTRSAATQLFRVLVVKSQDTSDLEVSVNELFALPTAGKTAGVEHRVTLYTMLGFIVPSADVSAKVIQLGAPLLSKETHDAAVKPLAASLGPHLLACMKDSVSLSKDIIALIVKEMTSTKPTVRRSFCLLAGSALSELEDFASESSLSFAQAALPSFETSLKTVSANPLGAPAGPLEGYIAVAVLLGPYARSNRFSE